MKSLSIVERIKSLCENQGITISFLEKKLGLGNGTIRRWDNTLPSGSKLNDTAKYFNVSIDYLVNGKDASDESDEEIRAIARSMKNLPVDKKKLLNDLIKTMSESGDEELKK